MTKRLVSLTLALIMALSCFSICVFASDDDQSSGSATGTVIYVESGYCVVGKTVDVDIKIQGNSGIAGAKISISYDENLTLVSANEQGGVFEILDYTAPGALSNPCVFNWDSLDAVANEDGTIITLTFEVSKDVSVDEVLDINVSYNYGDIYDVDLNSLTVTMVGGQLNVIDYLPGDVNGDGVVNRKDVTLVRRYNAGIAVEINKLAADVNDDGAINGKDVTLIRRYNAGWQVSLKPVTPVCAHDMVAVEEKDATCTEAGNIAYFTCTKCGKYFSDAEGKTEITAKETVIAMKGHTEVIDEAVAPTYTTTGKTEGSHCSVCNEILREQTEIPMLEAKYHSVTYRNTKDAVIPVEKMKYAEHEGLMELPVPTANGYAFKGWYTQSVGGELVDYIPVNDTKDYILFARWEVVTYTITYKDAPVNGNVTSYTTEDRIVLEDPAWSGLMFVNWTDENGNVVSVIEKGTAGDMILTANWKSYRNNVVPARNSKVMSAFRDEMGLYYFAYKLGTIENVVISSIADSYTKTTSAGRNLTLGKTINTSETEMSSIASTINRSFTSTKSWSDTTSWAKEHSNTKNFTNTLTAGVNFGKKDVWNVGISDSAEFGVTWGDSYSNSGTTVEGKTESGTSGSSLNTSSTISYANTMSMSESTAITIPGEMPNGLYDYVYTTTVTVYGVIIYDANVGDYCVGTYSTLGDLSTTLMYYKQPSDKDDYPCDGLDFDIRKTEEIDGIVNSSYYVQYDANGGEGTMLRSVHKVGEKSALQPNKFSRVGYTFAGWGTSPDGGVMYVDGSNVQDVAEKGAMVMLYAIWIPNSYKLTYNINDIYDLSASVNAKIYDVVFDGEYSLLVPDYKYSDYYEFAGWYTSSGEQLTDENGKSLSAWGSVKDCEIYARWNKKYEDYVYIRSREDLEAINSNPRCKYMLIDDILLFDEEWQPLNTFYGEFDGQDHIIAGMTIRKPWKECGLFARTEEAFIHNVQLENVIIENTYSKDYSHTGCIAGYAVETTIENCKVSGQIVTDPTSVVDEHLRAYANKLVGGPKNCTFLSNETHKLSVSIFLFARTSEDYTITDSGRWNQPKDILPISTAPLKMQDQSLDALKMTFWLDNKDIFRGNHWMFIYTYNDTWLAEHQFWAPDEGWGTTEFTYTLSISNIINNRIKILYGASGDMADDWMAGTLKIRVVF